MPEMTAKTARRDGLYELAFGLPFLALGPWLMWSVLAQPLPDWLQKPIRLGTRLRIDGLSASSSNTDRLSSMQGICGLIFLNMGGVKAGQGLIMLLLGRRSVLELALMLAVAATLLGFAWTV